MRPDSRLCPPEIVKAFKNYIQFRIPPGDFVRAVLENNLMEASVRADEENLKNLPNIVAWVYWKIPTKICGSREAVNAHLSSLTNVLNPGDSGLSKEKQQTKQNK